ncbi:MAG: hypothetical protein P1U68_01245 [Verrucomicrobiales bacterium]|nr:hypothetical protein [Verrucomicrobiales bacterium]
MKLTLAALFALTLISCQNRDTAVPYGAGETPPTNYGDSVPQGARQPTTRDHRRGVHDGKFDARNGYRYAIRGGNSGNEAYVDGYAEGYRSFGQ